MKADVSLSLDRISYDAFQANHRECQHKFCLVNRLRPHFGIVNTFSKNSAGYAHLRQLPDAVLSESGDFIKPLEQGILTAKQQPFAHRQRAAVLFLN